MSRPIAWIAVAFYASTAIAAPPPAPPPLDAIWDRDVVLAEARFVDQPAPNVLRFVDVDVIHGGPSRAEVLVTADDAALALVAPGKRYVLAWVEWMRSPANKKQRVRRAGGPQLVVSPGLSPALFEANAEVRALLLTPPSPERLESRKHLDRVLDGLADADPRLQTLFAGELFARSALRQALQPRDRERLRGVVQRADSATAARTLLLDGARIYPLAFGDRWVEVASALIAHEPVSMSGGQPNEGLVWSAFAILAGAGSKPPFASLSRWVPSGNGALAEQALLAIRRSTPSREPALIDSALRESQLSPSTRAFLLDHQRRLTQSAATPRS